MCNLKKKKKLIQMSIFTKQKQTLQISKANLQLPKRKHGGKGINQEFGMNIYTVPYIRWVSQVALVVKSPPASAGDIGDPVQYLDLEDPLQKGMATHSSILAWRIPWTEEPGGLGSMGLHRVRHY